jgi:malate dehydrogenase (oxaloacetate-decarboxylating)(NADP+)
MPPKTRVTPDEALACHREDPPGKHAIHATKPMATQRDLSLAYSPGVAVPVRAIADNPETAYDYTVKGNMVAVVSNGTATRPCRWATWARSWRGPWRNWWPSSR